MDDDGTRAATFFRQWSNAMEQLGPYQVDDVYCGDCAELMKELPAECIDLTCTSPPYDLVAPDESGRLITYPRQGMRDYDGYTWDFVSVAAELWRVTKPGGVLVWVVGDQTINGSETGSSFRQALHFMSLGFNMETMIYESSSGACGSNDFYWQAFEFVFVLTKGKPKTINLIHDRKNIHAGRATSGERRKPNGAVKNGTQRTIMQFSKRLNIWRYVGGDHSDKGHPAVFPEALARDHILSWSNPGDLVFDPMAGSGTTPKMAKENGRHWLAFDISQKYCDLIRRRVAGARVPLPGMMEALQNVTPTE
jgi:site-specific DNA-methyltransferase (adenine-specific)